MSIGKNGFLVSTDGHKRMNSIVFWLVPIHSHNVDLAWIKTYGTDKNVFLVLSLNLLWKLIWVFIYLLHTRRVLVMYFSNYRNITVIPLPPYLLPRKSLPDFICWIFKPFPSVRPSSPPCANSFKVMMISPSHPWQNRRKLIYNNFLLIL